MPDEIGWFQGISVSERKKKKTTKDLSQSDPISFLSSSLPHKFDCHSSILLGFHICTMHSLSQFCSFFYPSEISIYHTSYMILNFLQEVFPSHPKSEWFFPFHYPPQHSCLYHSFGTVPKMNFFDGCVLSPSPFLERYTLQRYLL